MSYTYLQAQGEESSAECFSDIPASVLLRLNLTAEKCSCNDSATEYCHHSPSGTMCCLAVYIDQRIMDAWTRNIDMEKSANALFVAGNSNRETREVSSIAARIPAEASFKQGKQFATVLFVEKNSCHLGQPTRHARAFVEQPFACLGGSSIRWLKSGTGLPCFAALSLRDACGTRPTEQHHFSDIRLMIYERILRRISSLECLGRTTEKEKTNGA